MYLSINHSAVLLPLLEPGGRGPERRLSPFDFSLIVLFIQSALSANRAEVLLLCVSNILTKLSNSSIRIMLKKPAVWFGAESSLKVWLTSYAHTRTYSPFSFFVWMSLPWWFYCFRPLCRAGYRGATARLMSVAGNWQMEASISPLIRGSRSPPTDRVQPGNVVPASSHPVRFIKRSLIPRHNIINFVSGWTQWTSNLINFYHWMLEGRLNEINAQYFPGRQPTLRAGSGFVGRSGAAVGLANYALFRPIHNIFLKRKIKSVVFRSIMSACRSAFWEILG